MAVTNLRITAKALLRCIHDAAKSSSNVVFVPELDKKSMAGMMTYQQAMSCLRSGSFLGDPIQNSHGHWEATMQRYAASHMFTLSIAVECQGAIVTRIFAFVANEVV